MNVNIHFSLLPSLPTHFTNTTHTNNIAMSQGRRQGNPTLGFEICPHTCGCDITPAMANRSRRSPAWMKRTPVFLRDGKHIKKHISREDAHPHCNAACGQLSATLGRPLTEEEFQAWVPHLGHSTEFHRHLVGYAHLFPPTPLEEDYRPHDLPSHPLLPRTIQDMLASLSLQPEEGAPKKLLFVGSPRIVSGEMNFEEAKGILTYDRYLIYPDTPNTIKAAIRTAPAGFAYREPVLADDRHPHIGSYYVHDMASFSYYFINNFLMFFL